MRWRTGLAAACLCGSLLAGLAGPGPALAQAGGAPPDPRSTQHALEALLGLAEARLGTATGCAGDYGQTGPARLKHLLASQLAYMADGQNRVQGRCEGDQCRLEITRRSGEDVSSATLSFRRVHGKAVASSLRCVMTP